MSLKKLNQRFPNKSAFITGAASGLGAEFAKRLAKDNWTLYLTDVDFGGLEELKMALSSSENVYVYALDVGNKVALDALAADLKLHNHQIDVLINNAGIGDGEFFRNYRMDAWERMIQINLMGVYYCTHFLLPLMTGKEGGLIINIGSAAGIMNAPGMSAYNVSKAAVFSFSETLRHELTSEGIQVSVATPTFFRTNIMSGSQGSEKFLRFAEKQMAQSTTNAEEVADLILRKAADGVFQIIHPFNARKSFFLKRWFPGMVNRMYQKMIARFRAK